MQKKNLVGIVGSLFILFIIYMRIRTRNAFDLTNELSFLTKMIFEITWLIFLLLIINRLYKIFFQNQKNIIYQVLEIKIKKIIMQNQYLIDVLNFFQTIGIYNFILYRTFEFIDNTIICKISKMTFNLLIFKGFIYEKNNNKKLNALCNNIWTRFLFNNVYWIFKFIPILLLNFYGIYEIVYFYQLKIYYKLLFLFLPIFILNILCKHQIFYHSRKCAILSEKYQIQGEILFDECSNKTKFYHIENILISIKKESDISLSEKQRILVIKKYCFHYISQFAAYFLMDVIDSYSWADVFLMILSWLYITLILIY